MNPLKSVPILVVAAWPLAVGGLAAQGVTTAALFGTVTSSDSTAIEDAVVTVTNTATGERWQTATRARGSYVFEYRNAEPENPRVGGSIPSLAIPCNSILESALLLSRVAPG